MKLKCVYCTASFKTDNISEKECSWCRKMINDIDKFEKQKREKEKK